jgi:hypothetical protein
MTTPESAVLLNSILEKVDKIELLLSGNGEPHKGMVVRLDRVEVKLRHADWVIKTILFVAATCVCGLISKNLF